MIEHLGDEAELYALGLLDDEQRRRVDDHLRGCDACAARVGAAEHAVTALVERSHQRPARRRVPWVLAAAAALIVSLGTLAQQEFTLRGALAGDGQLVDAMVVGHFAHVPFSAPSGGAIPAKVVYDSHGQWFAVIAQCPVEWRLTVIEPGGARHPLAQRPVRRGDSMLLFARAAIPVGVLELDDTAGHVLGRAQPNLGGDRS